MVENPRTKFALVSYCQISNLELVGVPHAAIYSLTKLVAYEDCVLFHLEFIAGLCDRSVWPIYRPRPEPIQTVTRNDMKIFIDIIHLLVFRGPKETAMCMGFFWSKVPWSKMDPWTERSRYRYQFLLGPQEPIDEPYRYDIGHIKKVTKSKRYDMGHIGSYRTILF